MTNLPEKENDPPERTEPNPTKKPTEPDEPEITPAVPPERPYRTPVGPPETAPNEIPQPSPHQPGVDTPH